MRYPEGPTRSEERDGKLIEAAESGNLSLEKLVAYPSEISKLEKAGFSVVNVRPFKPEKFLFYVDVDWSQAYVWNRPYLVTLYIQGRIQTYPKKSVNNFAQSLYIIAHRALNANSNKE